MWDKPDEMTSAAAPASSAPATEWVEMIDPNTGQPYYFDPKSGETSWTKPNAGAAGGRAGRKSRKSSKASRKKDREHAEALALAEELRGQNRELRKELKRLLGHSLAEPPPRRQPQDLHAEVVTIRMQNKSLIKQLREAKKSHYTGSAKKGLGKKRSKRRIRQNAEYQQRRDSTLS